VFGKLQRIHFVGIGGIGMSGIAEVLLTLGYKVSGSDLKLSPLTQRLARLGATIFEGHAAANIEGADVVVTNSAIAAANPEVAEARRRRVPVIQRAEMLAELMRLKYGIAIAGMHGKTTTTSMLAAVLAAGGLDPTVVVGGRVDALGSNARLGRSQYLVTEADESDRSFLKLAPIVAVVTNLDREHVDCYRDMDDVQHTFLDFMSRVPFYGLVVGCHDDPLLRKLLERVERPVVTYGRAPGADFRIADVKTLTVAGDGEPRSDFAVEYKGEPLGRFQLHVPGVHNVLNATAAIAVAAGLDVKVEHARAGLAGFRGVDRRFQTRGQAAGVTVVDDYGHHPTEIRATLAAARQCGFRRVHVVFQPHRYTRTQALLEDFATAFGDADSVFVLDIYPASEPPIPGVNGEKLALRIAERGGRHAVYMPGFEEAAQAAVVMAAEGDMILTLGAGNVSQVGPLLLEGLEARAAQRGHAAPST
jgi:UDP-N-acetylmuramate--alanine ligase